MEKLQRDGDTFARVTYFVEGTSSFRDYDGCYAYFDPKTGCVFVRAYDDAPNSPVRAMFSAALHPFLENHGKHKAPESPAQPSRQFVTAREVLEAGVASTKAQEGAKPSAANMPNEEEQEAALGRFLKAAPPAESHLPERKFLDSEEADAAPKVVTLPLETQPEEAERRVEAASETVTFGELQLSNSLVVRSLPPSAELPDNGGAARSSSKARKSSSGSHARPKAKATQALYALAIPLLGFFLRHHSG